MRGPAPHEDRLTMRNIVQHMLGITRADATVKCRQYSAEETAAILAADGKAEQLQAIAAADERIATEARERVTQAHAEAGKKEAETDVEKMQGGPEGETGNEADAETASLSVEGEVDQVELSEELLTEAELDAKHQEGASAAEAANEIQAEDAPEEPAEKPVETEKPVTKSKAKRKKKAPDAEEK